MGRQSNFDNLHTVFVNRSWKLTPLLANFVVFKEDWEEQLVWDM